MCARLGGRRSTVEVCRNAQYTTAAERFRADMLKLLGCRRDGLPRSTLCVRSESSCPTKSLTIGYRPFLVLLERGLFPFVAR